MDTQKILASSLKNEFLAIEVALRAVKDPLDEILQAQETKCILERKIKDYFDQPRKAVVAYNQARRRIVVDWALERNLGFCSYGKHLAPLDELEDLTVSGVKYYRKHYDEGLEEFLDIFSVCRACRNELQPTTGPYQGTYTNYRTRGIADPKSTLDNISYEGILVKIAQDNGIDIPPEVKVSGSGFIHIDSQIL